MKQNLKAIGFSEINNSRLSNMLTEVLRNPSCKYIIGKDREDIFIEYIKYFGKGIGITVRGYFDDNEEIIIENWAPYVETTNKLEVSEVDIDVNEKKEYFAICEEEETGNEIEFYLQNVVDFLNIEDDEDATITGAYVVGLAIEGTIILPIKKDFVDKVIEVEQAKFYKSLVKLMREGDNEAKQILQIQQEELTESISARLDKEDLFSVIESYFFEDDEQDLTYNILGNIKRVELITNAVTKEKIYKLNVDAMGINIDICINSKNVLGLPLVGMRFKGKCWIQGKLMFK